MNHFGHYLLFAFASISVFIDSISDFTDSIFVSISVFIDSISNLINSLSDLMSDSIFSLISTISSWTLEKCDLLVSSVLRTSIEARVLTSDVDFNIDVYQLSSTCSCFQVSLTCWHEILVYSANF